MAKKQAEVDDLDRELTADDILAADDLVLQATDVPEWPKNGRPGKVWLRMMSAHEAIKFTADNEGGGKKNFLLRLFALTACNKAGVRLFKQDQIPAIGEKAIKPFIRLGKEAAALNGLNADAADEKKALQDEKND